MSMDAESLSGTTSPSNLERQWTASPAVTPSLMPTLTVAQAAPYISSPASATEATSNPPAHPPGAPTEVPVHVSGTRCVSNLSFRCWGGDQVALKFAIHLCANSTLLRIVGWFHDDIFSDLATKLVLQGINFLQVTLECDLHRTNYFEEGTRRFNEESDTGGMISFQKRWSNACSFLVPYLRSWKCSPNSRQLAYTTQTKDDNKMYICDIPPGILAQARVRILPEHVPFVR
jgi:hypothetical protein